MSPAAVTARSLVAEVRAIAGARLPDERRLHWLRDALDRFVAGARVPRPETWRNTTGRYTRVLLNDPDDDFQIVVVFWPPGARSAVHDHDETLGAVMPLFGAVAEVKYAVEEREEGVVRLTPNRSATLEPHTFSEITPAPGEQLHDVVNETLGWAATLHVYLRRIDHFHVYANAGEGLHRRQRRRLWLDYHRGWERWDAPRETATHAELALCRSGHCLCGAVHFEFRAPPAAQLVCHCTDCQRATGSAMAPLAFFPTEALQIHSGQTRRYAHRNDSGHEVGKTFCSACGTTLFHNSSGSPHLTAIPVGVLDDASDFRPTTDIYVGSAPHWARVAPRPWDERITTRRHRPARPPAPAPRTRRASPAPSPARA